MRGFGLAHGTNKNNNMKIKVVQKNFADRVDPPSLIVGKIRIHERKLKEALADFAERSKKLSKQMDALEIEESEFRAAWSEKMERLREQEREYKESKRKK